MAYATTAQLVAYVGAGAAQLPADPAEQTRLLQRASDLLDGELSMARYRTDPVTLLPTDTDVINAFADAVCAQVEWWTATQDELGQMEQYESSSFEGVALSRGGLEPKRLCPRARERLRTVAGNFLVRSGVIAL